MRRVPIPSAANNAGHFVGLAKRHARVCVAALMSGQLGMESSLTLTLTRHMDGQPGATCHEEALALARLAGWAQVLALNLTRGWKGICNDCKSVAGPNMVLSSF